MAPSVQYHGSVKVWRFWPYKGKELGKKETSGKHDQAASAMDERPTPRRGKGKGKGKGGQGSHKGRGRGERQHVPNVAGSPRGSEGQPGGRGRGRAIHTAALGTPQSASTGPSQTAPPPTPQQQPPPRAPPPRAPPSKAPPLNAPAASPWEGLFSVGAMGSPALDSDVVARNAERQAEECMVLEAIYGDDYRQVPSTFDTIDLRVAVDLDGHGACVAGREGETLDALPPLTLRLQMPPSYPSHAPPALALSCAWLSDAALEQLCAGLDGVWAEGARAADAGDSSEVVCAWLEHLRSVALPALLDAGGEGGGEGGAASATSERCVRVHVPSRAEPLPPASCRGRRWPREPQGVLAALATHRAAAEHRAWAEATHTCGICFDEMVSVDCVRFVGCGHTFCKSCIGEYFEAQMADGAVGNGLIASLASVRAFCTRSQRAPVLDCHPILPASRPDLSPRLPSLALHSFRLPPLALHSFGAHAQTPPPSPYPPPGGCVCK